MSNSIRIIIGGILAAALSLGTWALTRAPQATGSPDAFEYALTQRPVLPSSPMAAGGEPGTPVDRADPTDGLRFTVSEDPPAVKPQPIGLRIPSLDQAAPIIPSGVAANGEMEIPDNVTEVAWYKFGPTPGESGSAVLAAHVDLAGQGPGVFFELRTLQPGSIIHVDFDDGSSAAFRAEARAVYGKSELPVEAIFSRSGPSVLTLITCGGDFNRSIRSYEDNVVVYAVPIDIESPDAI